MPKKYTTRKSEAEWTAEALRTDGMPDTTEMLYFSLLLWQEEDFIAEVTKFIDGETMWERLEFKLKLWVPYALEMLRTEWKYAIESSVGTLLDARKQFPKSIETMFTLEELALIRRDAHIRAGKNAVAYLETGESQMQQPSLGALADALLAGVPRQRLGNPPMTMVNQALKGVLPDKTDTSPRAEDVRRVRQVVVDAFGENNRLLNPLLPKLREVQT